MLSRYHEQRIWMMVIPAIWFFYWLVGVISKFITRSIKIVFEDIVIGELVLPSELDAYKGYFALLGISDEVFPVIFFIFVVILECVAALLMLIAVIVGILGNKKISRTIFFFATLMGIGIFLFLILASQVFGDRARIVEYAVFLSATLLSWHFYNKFGGFNNQKT